LLQPNLNPMGTASQPSTKILISLRVHQTRQPSTRLDGQAPPEEGDSKTAAQRSKRRRREISDRRMPTGREALEVFQDAGVHPKSRR